MKSIIPITILVMLVMIIGVSAQSLPMIIDGRIKNEGNLGGFTVTMENLRTGTIVDFVTGGDGYFQFNPQNYAFGAYPHDDFKISTEGQIIMVDDIGSIPITLEFDLTGQVCPKPDPCPEPDICPPPCPEDLTPYADCDSCCPVVTCPEPEVCEVCEEPKDPVENFDWAIAAVIAVFGSAGATLLLTKNRIGLGYRTGFKIYKGVDGEEKRVHKHPGIREYHSPDTQHNDINIRHPRGMIIANYVKIDDKWQYRGN